MSNLIDRQAAIKKINERQRKLIYCFGFENDSVKIMDIAKSIVIAIPSVQPEKVKCKKCRYVYYDKEFGNYWCNRMSGSFKVEEDGYCKWGK